MINNRATSGQQTITERIKTHARSLGFDLVRVTDAFPHNLDGQRYQRWLARGNAADMEYLKRTPERRWTPTEIVPDAKSIIMLGINYFHSDKTPSPRVAQYAHGRDYHKVITAKLKQLARYIEAQNPAPARAEKTSAQQQSVRHYVDFGPLLERSYAAHAQMGFIGKNTCIITREYGSWIFLAEVITTLQLDPDPPTTWKGGCGTCHRCIDACPTNAIGNDASGGHSIDARRCISYLTIENRGPIPLELRAKIGTWLFGCDICQDVCPHNVRAQPTRVDDFKKITIGEKIISLKKILALKTDEEFTALFAGTPFMRAKRRGLIRNACVVAGNIGDRSLLPQLRALTRSTDPLIAEHAAWAIDTMSRTVAATSPNPSRKNSVRKMK